MFFLALAAPALMTTIAEAITIAVATRVANDAYDAVAHPKEKK